MQTVNIMGTDYTIEFHKEHEDPKLNGCNGYTELYQKKIIIEDMKPDTRTVERLDLLKQTAIRHEIIHAFLMESGLDVSSDWARNEEVVDWIAIQIPKLVKAMQEAGCLE